MGARLTMFSRTNESFSPTGITPSISWEPDTGKVAKVTGAATLRYSNFSANSASPCVLAVEEDDKHNTPAQVKNYVVGINTENCGVARAVPRADYYYTPQFSADGTKLAWLEWDHPNLFSGAKLFSADWNSGGYATNATIVAGENNEGVAEPRYEPDGSLSTARRLIAIVSFIGSPRIRARPFGWSWRLYLAPKLVSVCFPS